MNRKTETTSNHQTDHKRGDLRKVPQCGATTRRKTRCQSPAMANGRCRLHGGLSTGPRTRAGIERIRQANTRHGDLPRLFQPVITEDFRTAANSFGVR